MPNTLFPSSDSISPSVRFVERDFSAYSAGFSTATGAMAGYAAKGPFNTPVLVTNRDELFQNFGRQDPDVASFLIQSAVEFLKTGRRLWVVRCGIDDPGHGEQAKTASVEVVSAGEQASIISETTGAVDIPVGGLTLRVRVNGGTAIRQFTLPESTAIDLVGTTDSVEALLLAQIQEDDAVEITHTDDDRLVFRSKINGASGLIEAISAEATVTDGVPGQGTQPDATGQPDLRTVDFWQDIMGVGQGMTRAGDSAALLGTNSYWPLANSAGGDFDLSSYENLNLQIVVYGTGDTAVDGVTQTFYLPRAASGANSNNLTAANIRDAINDGTYAIPTGESTGTPSLDFTARPAEGFIAYVSAGKIGLKSLHRGRDAKILVRSESTADTVLGLSNVTVAGATPEVDQDVAVADPTRVDAGIVNGVDGDGLTESFTVNASTAGTEGNQTSVNVVRRDSGRFDIQVLFHGAHVETHANLTKDDADDRYVETWVNALSNYVSITDNTATEEGPLPGSYALGATDATAGTNGIPSSVAEYRSYLIGDDFARTGIYALSNREQYDVDVVAIPGVSDSSVVSALQDFCESREDCLGIVDPPQGLEPWEVIAWHNGQHPLNSTRLDSSYLALYWPWVEVRDTVNKVDVLVPPSGPVMAQIAYSEFVSHPWYAPAGLRRGVMTNVNDVETAAFQEDRDLMYGRGNAVNTIFKPNNLNVSKPVMWGNKTLQRSATALNRINVRRLLFYIEKRIGLGALRFIEEPNVESTRQAFVDMAEEILAYVKTNNGLYDYVVVCDETVNTPEVVDRNEFRARVGIQPVKAIEFIFLEFGTHRTGTFEETEG